MMGDSLVDFGNWRQLLPGYSVINRGMPGERARELLARVSHGSCHETVDGVIVMTGTNDLLSGTTDLAETMQAIISRIQQNYPASIIMINSLVPFQIPHLQKTVRRVNTDLHSIAETTGATYLDLYQRFEESGKTLFEYDGVHLNNSGYQLWAELLSEVLGTLLAKDRD
jgi:lysophospholipase L1-like esterase